MAKIPSKGKAAFFTRGESAAKKARAQVGDRFRPDFWMRSGETAKIVFLDKESWNVMQHVVKLRGKTRKYTCPGSGCPLCKIDEPRFFAVFRIIDTRKFTTKDGKGKTPPKEKYYEVGMRMQPVIARLMKRKQLYKKVSEISRDGEGTATSYQLVPVGPITDKLKAVIGEMLQPKLDFEKDFGPKSIEELRQLAAALGGPSDDEEDDDAETPSASSYLNDEDEDDDESDDEDEDSDDEDEDDEDEDDEDEDDDDD